MKRNYWQWSERTHTARHIQIFYWLKSVRATFTKKNILFLSTSIYKPIYRQLPSSIYRSLVPFVTFIFIVHPSSAFLGSAKHFQADLWKYPLLSYTIGKHKQLPSPVQFRLFFVSFRVFYRSVNALNGEWLLILCRFCSCSLFVEFFRIIIHIFVTLILIFSVIHSTFPYTGTETHTRTSTHAFLLL